MCVCCLKMVYVYFNIFNFLPKHQVSLLFIAFNILKMCSHFQIDFFIWIFIYEIFVSFIVLLLCQSLKQNLWFLNLAIWENCWNLICWRKCVYIDIVIRFDIGIRLLVRNYIKMVLLYDFKLELNWFIEILIVPLKISFVGMVKISINRSYCTQQLGNTEIKILKIFNDFRVNEDSCPQTNCECYKFNEYFLTFLAVVWRIATLSEH